MSGTQINTDSLIYGLRRLATWGELDKEEVRDEADPHVRAENSRIAQSTFEQLAELPHKQMSHEIGMAAGVGMFLNSIVILVANSYTADLRWAIVVGLVVGIVWTTPFAVIHFADNHLPSVNV